MKEVIYYTIPYKLRGKLKKVLINRWEEKKKHLSRYGFIQASKCQCMVTDMNADDFINNRITGMVSAHFIKTKP